MNEFSICKQCEYSKTICQNTSPECPYHLEHQLQKETKFYVYQIGYGTCEESQEWQYVHTKQFTEDELKKIIEDAFFYALKEREEKEDSSFQELMSGGWMGVEFFHKYLESQGFTHLKYEQQFDVFGWMKATDPEDWKTYSSPEDRQLAQNLKDRLKKYNQEKSK